MVAICQQLGQDWWHWQLNSVTQMIHDRYSSRLTITTKLWFCFSSEILYLPMLVVFLWNPWANASAVLELLPCRLSPAHSQQFKLSCIRAGPWILVTQIVKSLGCVSGEEHYSMYCWEGGLQQPFDFEVAKFWSLLNINTLCFGDLVAVLINKKYLTLIRIVHLFVQCHSRAFWLRMFWIRQAGTSSQDMKTGCFCENWD